MPRESRPSLPNESGSPSSPAILTRSGDLLDPSARWGAPQGPHEADCQNRDQVVAWWASARAAGARAVVTEVTTGAGTFLVGLEVTGTPAAREAGGAVERWQVLTLRGDRIVDIRGYDDRAAAAARAGVPRLSA